MKRYFVMTMRVIPLRKSGLRFIIRTDRAILRYFDISFANWNELQYLYAEIRIMLAFIALRGRSSSTGRENTSLLMETSKPQGTEPRKTHPKMKFTTDEDFLLGRCIVQFGANNWDIAASLLPGRSARQCRERWTKYLSPTNSFEPFTPEEDRLLMQLHAQWGSKWMKMSQFFKNRTDITLKNRWLVLMRQQRKATKDDVTEMAVPGRRSLDATSPDPFDIPGMSSWPSSIFGDDDLEGGPEVRYRPSP
jgi:hypothetical protein